MKFHWVLWSIIGLAFGEKLDRTYLPAVGSVTSGGSQGAIDLPFSYPKYSINEKDFPEETEIAIGIDRVGPKQSSDIFENISTPNINNDKDLLVPINDSFEKVTQFSHNDVYSTTIPETFSSENHLSTNSKNFQSTDNNVSNFLPISDHTINIEQNIYDKNSPPSVLYNVSGDPTHSKLESSTYPFSLSPSDEQYKYTSLKPSYSLDNPYPTIDSQFTSTISMNHGNADELYTHHETGRREPERLQAQTDREAVILNYDQTRTPEGYAYSYDTSNGIHADENGTATNGVRTTGSYSYIGDDGKLYSVTYTADENGFQPKGNHLPTPPPIPDAILKVIQQAEKQRETGIYDNGFYDDNKYGYRRYKEKIEHQHPVTYKIPPKLSDSHFKKHNEDLEQRSGTQKSIINPSNNRFQYSAEEQNFTPIYDDIFKENNNSELKHFKNDETFDPQYDRNSMTYNNTEKVLSTEYPFKNNFSEISIDPKNDITTTSEKFGYHNFPEQNRFYNSTMLKMFPVRFSSIDQDLKAKEKEKVTDNVTPKPFLTPYVSRRGEESENNDSDYNTSYPSSLQDNLEQNKGLIDHDRTLDLNYFVNNMKLDQSIQKESRTNDVNTIIPSDSPGYFYAKNNLDLTIPTVFPSRFITTMTNDFIPVTDRESTPFKISTTSAPNFLLEAMRPGYIGDQPISGYSTPSTESDLISSNQNIISGPNSAIYKTQFQSTTDATLDPNFYTKSLAYKKNIGENFNGPRQDQGFDSSNGYYY